MDILLEYVAISRSYVKGETQEITNTRTPELFILKDQDKVTTATQAREGDKTTQIQIQGSHPPTTATACVNQDDKDCLSPDDTFYCNPEFLEEVEQLETMAREKMQQKKRMDFTPPSFNLGISLEKGRCASRSLNITPATLKFSVSHKGGANASITGRTCQPTENADNLGKSQGSTKQMHKPEKEKPKRRNARGEHGITKQPMWKDLVDIQANKKGKEVAVRQQPKRIVKEVPFLCRSLFLKDYREARDQLKPTQLMLVDYAFLPPDELHPSMYVFLFIPVSYTHKVISLSRH
ncbi:hypothetical protein Cgig2_032670 [Carnegiea gigantea]|uniref:Uncharacterized protein n=1 Tax=Carnegiea gigantea TaxID=171969 RepID=A0A9Q1GQR9_9CARY|nr:hypothetical protein Cgig2_032670 [Carnegiea gigantea]